MIAARDTICDKVYVITEIYKVESCLQHTDMRLFRDSLNTHSYLSMRRLQLTSMPNNATDLTWLLPLKMSFTSGVTIEKRVFGIVARWRGPKELIDMSGAVEPRAEEA